MNTVLYAIRHKHTQLYMPDRQGKGYSNDEPTSKDRPRLFWKRKAAEAALAAWLKGRWVKKFSWCHRWDEGVDDELEIVPVAGRVKEDMEIIPMSLRLLDQSESYDYPVRPIGEEGQPSLTITEVNEAGVVTGLRLTREAGQQLLEMLNKPGTPNANLQELLKKGL